MHFRKLGYYSDFNQTGFQAKFNTTSDDLNTELTKWRNLIAPLYTSGPGTTMYVDIYDWNGVDYVVKSINAFESVALVLVTFYMKI